MVCEDVVLSDETDIGVVELVESGLVLDVDGVDGKGVGSGYEWSHVELGLVVSESLGHRKNLIFIYKQIIIQKKHHF